MSLRSMTGFGRGEASGKGLKVTVELSSVNRKQLDVRVGLPRTLSALDSRVTDEVHKVIMRGRVTGEVVVSTSGQRRTHAIRVDEELAAVYLKALRTSARRLDLPDDFTGSQLLSLPSVVRFEELTEDSDVIWPYVSRALRRALRELVEMKDREGAALQTDLTGRLDRLGKEVAAVVARAPQVVKHYRRALLKRIGEAGLKLDRADDRLLKEVALFADRSDISEEITRLQSHLGQAARRMKSKPPSGKALDFLAQEMFREINTIGSKANDAIILRHVVEFKAELERVREQVQNLE